MIRSLYWTREGPARMNLPAAEMPATLGRTGTLLWVDLADDEPAAFEPLLHDTFRFHPLAIEDALRELHVAKIDDWGDYVYLVLHALLLDLTLTDPVQLLELDVFVGPNYIVTHHEGTLGPLERVWDALRDGRPLAALTPGRLLHLLADELVASHLPIVEQVDDAIEHVEDAIFHGPDTPALEQILDLKRGVLQLRRAFGPQREVYNRLARDPYAVIAEGERVYFRDTYDQTARLLDITDSIREQATSALDTYLSAVNNRMNDVMKTLTVITTLFMPLSFVASFFGMNFFGPAAPLPEWTGLPAFAATLLLMAATPVAMYLWMRGRRWM